MARLTRSEDISLEIRDRVALLLSANGAETNVGQAVYLGRKAVDDSMIPCTVIIEGNDDPVDSSGSQVKTDQQYVLMSYLPCDADHPNTAAHAALRDLKRAVFRTDGKFDQTMGGKVKKVEYLGRDIGPRADGSAFVLAIVEISIEHVEDLANP